MSDSQDIDVDEALREVDVLVNSIDDEIVDTISDQTNQGEPVKGRVAVHGNHTYQIFGTPESRSIVVRSGFDAAETLAANVASDGGQPVQPSGSGVMRARTELRNRVSDDDISDIREGLISRISTDEFIVQLNTDASNEEFVTGFQVESRLFPYDQSISVAEFHDEVQSVINAMWRGKEFLTNEYGLRDTINGQDIGPRGFQ